MSISLTDYAMAHTRSNPDCPLCQSDHVEEAELGWVDGVHLAIIRDWLHEVDHLTVEQLTLSQVERHMQRHVSRVRRSVVPLETR